MPNTPKKPKLTQDVEQEPSPAKAILATPPRLHCQAFFFVNPNGNKAEGLTPNGTRRVALRLYEGRHHHRVRDVHTPEVIVDGDNPLVSPHKNQPEAQMLRLDALFANLKNRSDSDFHFYEKDGEVDEGHFQASIQTIKKCIAQLKHCYKLAVDPEVFITDLNARIAEGKIYNPFGLQQIYHPMLGYQNDLAKDSTVFQSPLDVDLIIPPPVVKAAKAKPEKRNVVCGGLFDGLPPPIFNTYLTGASNSEQLKELGAKLEF